ncbi:hypothetical protein VKT23_015663 [Stygiomarasmius scandens]|uniref:Heme haloperoxidase family profile domain-containing protein n=1 Tax=Marasmiellus scandens TaxID=2682957 RepID=A0ABR1IWW4_9AGAR
MYSSFAASSSTENLLPSRSQDHQYSPPEECAHRAPCPGLNTLANHNYIPRSGTGITFLNLISAVAKVYNLSLPLTLLLALPGFIIYGRFNFPSCLPWTWSYTVDLADLASFGPYKIAHPASLVHPNYPSHAPDPDLLFDFLSFARSHGQAEGSPSSPISCTLIKDLPSPSPPPSALSTSPLQPSAIRPVITSGLSLFDFAQLRIARESQLSKPLNTLHEQIALGESALTWLVFHQTGPSLSDKAGACAPPDHVDNDLIVPVDRLVSWFGEEKLPDRWFEDVRPQNTIGLLQARRVAGQIQKDTEILQWRKEASKV